MTLKRYASFLGLSNTTSSLGPLPINLGPEFNNTSLLVDPVVLVSLDPFAWLEIPIPPSPALIGAHVYAQGIGYGMLGALFSGWGLTAGVDLQLGWL